MLFYSNNPYVAGNSGCDDGNHPNGPSDGELVGGLSHEHNESITDPIPERRLDQRRRGESRRPRSATSAKARWAPRSGTAPNGAKYNQVINGHFYWYQEEWSNQRPHLPPAAHAVRHQADGDVHGHRRQRARHDIRRHGLDRTGRRRRLRLAVQRRVRRPDRRADDRHDHAHVPGGGCLLHRLDDLRPQRLVDRHGRRSSRPGRAGSRPGSRSRRRIRWRPDGDIQRR